MDQSPAFFALAIIFGVISIAILTFMFNEAIVKPWTADWKQRDERMAKLRKELDERWARLEQRKRELRK